MSASAPVPTSHAEIISMASTLWARTTSAANIAGEVAKWLPTDFEPASLKANLGLCCRLLEWALLETGYALESLKAMGTASLPRTEYVTTCDEQYARLRACLATAMAIGELMRRTRFHYEGLLFAGLIPDLDEQVALLAAIRAGASASAVWKASSPTGKPQNN